MLSLEETISKLVRNRAKWDELLHRAHLARASGSNPASTRLKEIHSFGSNPGNLRMFRYVPPRLARHPALVVVLHGCTQTAASYDHGAGWSTLADRYGFVLVFPEQQRSNNPNGCFNWFLPGDIERDHGEALSIRQMVAHTTAEIGVDQRRVFVTGLSAGGAMTSVMLACYPDVFAGGAIIAGLPYRAATNVQQAFESMFQSPVRSADEWGDLVRRASPHRGPWPRTSVWHGNADTTVIPANVREILKQWTNVHAVPLGPSYEATVDGYPRAVWVNGSGEELIESYTIPQMVHGTPLATGEAEGRCGTAGPFFLDVGISSSYHIAHFFGLTQDVLSTRQNERRTRIAEGQAAEKPQVLEGEVLPPEPDLRPPPPRIDIGAIINRALKSAGLMKDG